jgi:hypothetical protein
MVEKAVEELAEFESRLDEEIQKTEKEILDAATDESGTGVRLSTVHGKDFYLDSIPGGELKEELFPPAIKAYVEYFRSRGFQVRCVMGKDNTWFFTKIDW